MKNRFMAAIGVLLVSISCIASTACVCSAANPMPKALSEITKTATVETSDSSEDEDFSFSNIDDFEIYFNRPYAHVTNEVLALGDGEIATLTLVCSPANRTDDDFLFFYNHDVVAPSLVEIENDEENNQTLITFTMNKVAPGETDFAVCSGFDYYIASMMGKDAFETVNKATIHFINLDEKDGKIVYASNKDKTYSADKSKMGKDAEETTVYDMKVLGYTEK